MAFAALFPGQGSHALGMGRDFHEHSPAARAVLDEAEATLPGLLELMFEGPLEELTLTANQQPALVAASAAAWAAFRELAGPEPLFAAGHSLGEFSALHAAGALPLAEALRLVRQRGQFMQEAVAPGVGAMAAVMRLEADAISQALAGVSGVVEVANFNSPQQTVISGESTAVQAASVALKELGGRVIPLKVSAPFHCSLMQPAAEQLAPLLEAAEFTEPAFPVLSNVTARAHVPSGIAARLTGQVTSAVRWVESLQQLQASGVTTFIEFGSGQVLTGLTGRTLDGVSAHAVTDMASLQAALDEVRT